MDINFSIPEETRPSIYSAMKYWGKKPHQIPEKVSILLHEVDTRRDWWRCLGQFSVL